MKQIKINESIVPDNLKTIRIDKYLADRFNYLSRTGWQKEIDSGRIFCNGEKITNYHKKIKSQDIITYKGRDIKEPEVDINYTILYEDEFIIAINKTGNLPVHPAGRYFNNTLLMDLQDKYKFKFYPIHRIDRETSGVIILAKELNIASLIQKNFNSINKSYIAIVHGNIENESFLIDTPIGDDKNSVVRKKRSAYKGAKESAITKFKKIINFNNYCLVKAFPESGRLHQIRVHLKYAGHPIIGDKLYGLDEKLYLEFIDNGYSDNLIQKMGFYRSALHSRSIYFYHPGIKKDVYIKAPILDDMKLFIEKEYKNLDRT